MNKNIILFLFLGLILIVGFTKHTFIFAQTVDDLTIMTEIYPPYNFEDNGELKGISVDLMVLMLARVGSKLDRDDIKLGPRVSDGTEEKEYCSFFNNKDERKRTAI